MQFADEQHDYFAPGSWPFYRRAAIAPLCLCIVAAVHLSRVYCCDQTPWKGGGFGMFSTVDDPYARTVRVYLITDEGEFPVEPPAHLHKRVSELQAAPSRLKMEQLAERLAKSRWRHRDRYWRSFAADARQRSGQASIDGQAIQSVAVSEAPPVEPAAGAASPIEAAPSGPRGAAEVTPQAVRVELWRQRFDARSRRLLNRMQWRHTYRRGDSQESA